MIYLLDSDHGYDNDVLNEVTDYFFKEFGAGENPKEIFKDPIRISTDLKFVAGKESASSGTIAKERMLLAIKMYNDLIKARTNH